MIWNFASGIKSPLKIRFFEILPFWATFRLSKLNFQSWKPKFWVSAFFQSYLSPLSSKLRKKTFLKNCRTNVDFYKNHQKCAEVTYTEKKCSRIRKLTSVKFWNKLTGAEKFNIWGSYRCVKKYSNDQFFWHNFFVCGYFSTNFSGFLHNMNTHFHKLLPGIYRYLYISWIKKSKNASIESFRTLWYFRF
jgi:hypothetical protein